MGKHMKSDIKDSYLLPEGLEGWYIKSCIIRTPYNFGWKRKENITSMTKKPV